MQYKKLSIEMINTGPGNDMNLMEEIQAALDTIGEAYEDPRRVGKSSVNITITFAKPPASKAVGVVGEVKVNLPKKTVIGSTAVLESGSIMIQDAVQDELPMGYKPVD